MSKNLTIIKSDKKSNFLYILYYTTIYCIVLYGTKLYCYVPYCDVLYSNIQNNTYTLILKNVVSYYSVFVVFLSTLE